MCSSAPLVEPFGWNLFVGTALIRPDDWSLLIEPIGLVGPVNESLCALPLMFGVSAASSGAKV